ncbi:MAG: hypothetical protein LUM44_17825 [Pyrinomonadaceae bacterium]|nr:hypothetical protein [Pyrinomonadaceae bacterium]
MAKGSDLIHLKIPTRLIVSESEKSYGVQVEGDPKVFVPKSQIKDVERNDEEIRFWCPMWLVEQNKLEGFKNTDYEPTLF